jgi:hypothetical protein
MSVNIFADCSPTYNSRNHEHSSRPICICTAVPLFCPSNPIPFPLARARFSNIYAPARQECGIVTHSLLVPWPVDSTSDTPLPKSAQIAQSGKHRPWPQRRLGQCYTPRNREKRYYGLHDPPRWTADLVTGWRPDDTEDAILSACSTEAGVYEAPKVLKHIQEFTD